MDYGLIAIKLSTGFIGLWLMTRLLGKKEIAQLTPFDFVSSLMLSELVGNTVYQKDVQYAELLFGLFLWALLSYLFEKLTQKSKRLRGPLEGEPSMLIRGGLVDMREMRANKLDFEQLRMMLRQKEIFSIREVAYAIFEPNGSLSVLRKTAAGGLSYSLVEDGEVDRHSLERIGKDEKWLSDELQKMGYRDPRRVAYAEWMQEEGFYVLEHKYKPV
jgi:uncharacterized membrane protein YcaP (DUF421 family)